jgi:MerR family transcriptional regulator, light-induced transcriptional regulator
MNAFTIKDLENLSGIKAHTIRIWEQRYNFLRPQRTNTNIRYYSNEELKTILNIALLNKYGFKISHINQMQPEEICHKILLLGDTAEKERIVNGLVQQMIDLDIEEFEKILNKHITAKGVEKTVLEVIFPFLEKIGILWQTGNIHPAQEHLVSNIIRQKLIAAIEKTTCNVKHKKTVMLFLPEGEHHELGLLFIYYLLKCRGIKTIYLGANVPLSDVQHVIALKKPHVVFIHLTVCATYSFDKFLAQIHRKLSNIPLVISGQVTHNYQKITPQGIHLKRTLHEVMDYLEKVPRGA